MIKIKDNKRKVLNTNLVRLFNYNNVNTCTILTGAFTTKIYALPIMYV